LLAKIIKLISEKGIKGVFFVLYNKLIASKLSCYSALKPYFINKSGLEIGGPSGHFERGGLFPIYSYAQNVDNCNFSVDTTWEGKIEQGNTFQFNKNKKPGYQFISEATDLSDIQNETYDFVLSSHTLEHSANPLKAMFEWYRVLKNDGILILVLPHYENTFDHNRPVTPLQHMIDDYNEDMTEADLTHLDEILKLHDLTKDPGAGSFDSFKKRSLKNLENRCLHQHVFNTESAIEVVDYTGMKILAVEVKNNFDIFIMSQKAPQGEKDKIKSEVL